MSEFISINDQEALTRFISEVDGLHDALLHELVLSHPGYVNEVGLMFGDTECPDVRAILQSQFRDVLAVQIEWTGVVSLRFDQRLDLRLEGEIRKDGVILWFSGQVNNDRSHILARHVRYRRLGVEYMGPTYRLANTE